MSLNRFVRQLKPIQENKVNYVDRIQSLRELTISPDYVYKGEENPFYEFKPTVDVEKDIRPFVGKGEIKFRNVKEPVGTEIKNYGGTKKFQISVDGSETDKYITTRAEDVAAHYGRKQRKDATASSNVNEFLSVYFLLHRDYTTPQDFMYKIGGKIGDTGVMDGDETFVDYDDLKLLLDKDETPERDIAIGWNNSNAIINDLANRSIDDVYWTPAKKPNGVGEKNPSDVIIKLTDGGYVGYSNKISAGKDVTPKINTNIDAFYRKLTDSTQVMTIRKMLDKAWNDASALIPRDKRNTRRALDNFDISREKFSETSSKDKFAKLSREFKKDKLNFYTDGMYYPFRNNSINAYRKHIENASNLMYLLNTVGFYTFDDADSTPCPYKLLIGGEKKSVMKEVTSDEKTKDAFLNKNPRNLTNIKTTYDNKSQTFKLFFNYKPLKMNFQAAMVLRTRAKGGWSGKGLYITTTGFKKRWWDL